MANGFQFLAQSMAPDIIGSFNRGRERVRQEDREQLADQELRANIDRGNRLRQLAPRALTAATRDDRQQVLGEIAAVDPRAAPEYEQQFADRDERARASLGNAALLLTSVPPEARAGLYQREFLPNLRSLGIELPDQYTPEVDATAMKIASVLSRQMGGQTPARVAGFQGMTQGMSPEDTERARRVELGLEGRASSAGFGFRTVTLPDGREALVVTDPRTGEVRPATATEIQRFMGGPDDSTPAAQRQLPSAGPGATGGGSGMPLAGPTPAELERQKSQGRLGAQLEMEPQIAEATAEAKARGEARGGIEKKAVNANTVLGMLDLADPLIDAATGSLAGAGRDALAQAFGAAPEGAQAIAQLRVLQAALMTNMPRMEGPQSDRDVELYRQAAGQIGDPTVPTGTKKASVMMIRALQQQYAGGASRAAPGGPQRQSTAAPPTNARGWSLMQDAQGNRAYVSPDGAQFEEAPAGAAPAAPSTEVTATGPNGQKIVLRGGQWVPLQ